MGREASAGNGMWGRKQEVSVKSVATELLTM